MTHYRQCELHRADDERTTSWLPEKFAVMGKILRLRIVGEWSDGWRVVKVGEDRLAEDKLPDVHKLLRVKAGKARSHGNQAGQEHGRAGGR